MDAPQDRLARLRSEISAARSLVKDRIAEWQENIDYRVHRNNGAGRTTGDVTVPIDWSMTKQKHAQLFSGQPDARLTANPGFEQTVPAFAKKLNRTLRTGGAFAAMNEILPDVINAAGIGACIVAYESRTEMRQLPVAPGAPVMTEQPYTTAKRFYVERFSPADLIVDPAFTGSDFDQSRLVGRRRRTTWEDLARLFNLKPEQREDVEKEAGIGTSEDRIQSENNRSTAPGNLPLCSYTEVYYRRYFYHEDEPTFDAIQRVVFVDGIEAPVVDEAWAGQRYDQQSGMYFGSCKYPIRILTLAYITDDAVPPSDSAMARGQVIELNNARTELQLQRKHSKPLRWADSNRLDSEEIDKINRGEWNDFIFTKGPGDGVVGEIARANYPAERYEFNATFKDDLYLAYQTSPNQMGAITPGETTAAESNNAQAGFQTRVVQERTVVANFYAGVAEVMGGLLSLYGDFKAPEFTPQEIQAVQGAQQYLSTQYAYTVHPASVQAVDPRQRFAELKTFVDIAGQSGYVQLKPILTEMAELAGLDPMRVMMDPPPRQPEPLNISIRSSEDLMNPAMMSLLVHTGQAPTPEDMSAGMKIIDMAMSMMPKITTPDEGNGSEAGGVPTAEPGDPQLALDMMPTITKRTDM